MTLAGESFDETYVRRLLEGDEQVQQHFTTHFNQLLKIKLRRRLKSEDAIEDVRQETFVRVLGAIKSGALTSPERLGGFVHSVCNNVLHEYWRAQSPNGTAECPDEVPGVPSVEQELVSEQRKRWAREILDSLSAQDREILRLVFLDERERDEVCARFDVDRAYLRVLVHRATTRLRKRYGKQWSAFSIFF